MHSQTNRYGLSRESAFGWLHFLCFVLISPSREQKLRPTRNQGYIMALIPCPSCGKMISPRAEKCPQCGCCPNDCPKPQEPEVEPEVADGVDTLSETPEEMPAASSAKWMPGVLRAAIIVAIVSFVIGYVTPTLSTKTQSIKQPTPQSIFYSTPQ